jgi:hypothetical protein
MYSCPPCVIEAIPGEYRETAEALFPLGGFPAEGGPSIEAAEAFAGILGTGADYRHILFNNSERDMDQFLGHFQNNLDLLIQKTWVEKADEIRKEKLLDRIPGFIARIEREEYSRALEEFGSVLEELAYLLFGVQSHKEDFTEYTFRIDTQMGLFWWYGGQISRLRETGGWDKAMLRALLLIGICYLTNF